MIDFSFSSEQELIRDTAHRFAQKELLPKYGYWDKHNEFPAHLVAKMADLGFMGMTIPKKYGGQELERVSNGIVVEELAKGDFNLSILTFGLMGDVLTQHGTEEQREYWLPALAQGKKILGISLTETESGSDAGSIKTTAIRDGDEWVINGEKSTTSIINADGWLLLARTNPKDSGPKGISCFLLTRDAPGLTLSTYQDLGGRVIPRGPIALENVRLPLSSLLGDLDRGFPLIMNAFDYNRALIGLMCLGAAEQTLDETIQFAKQRKSFGRFITTNQGVSFPLAEAATYLEFGRWACYRVLWLRDQNLPHTKESAMVKWWVPKTCVEVIHTCLLVHGHYGYTQDFHVEQRLRDVLGWQIGDGTAQIQKLIIARHIIGREYV
ncbi:MAG: acyl-CoA dehydrogenase family protein [Candidatus Tectomicrobia bacterium]|uniref:Acyl-CoA dehydrogenase family protein n=1 Tax=Tectimicrobiota bacterium TaxID=2528274 RepID=A0A933GLV8_UNCTE|nr:acyl-CoA dehydrogenase family protein [Candidatus Tectomicrobia bacterium]